MFCLVSCLDTCVSAVSQVSQTFSLCLRLVLTKSKMSWLVSCLDTSVLSWPMSLSQKKMSWLHHWSHGSRVVFLTTAFNNVKFRIQCLASRQWCRSVVKYGVSVSQVKPSNCFTLHPTSIVSKYSTIRCLTACRRLEKLVLPSTFGTCLSSLMMWNLQTYPTTVLNERMWHFRGLKPTLTPPIYFQGPRPEPSRIYAVFQDILETFFCALKYFLCFSFRHRYHSRHVPSFWS